MTLGSTPHSDGFRMPAEYEPHAGCWMLWPERQDVWRENARPAQQAFTDAAAAIARYEPVTVGVSAGQYRQARDMLPRRARLVELSANDAWMRDCGPVFVVNDEGEVRGVDWGFNAWGGLYADYELDSQVAQKVLEIEGLARYLAQDLILEGGAIHVDGQGTLITTEECLCGRNAGLTRTEIESWLQAYLGVETIVWLPRGVVKDETSGHIDNLCCFVRPGMVALTWTDDQADEQYDRSREALDCLAASVDVHGRPFDIRKIPQPAALYRTPEESEGVTSVVGSKERTKNERLAASYINFYIANHGVVVPQFGDANDRFALQLIQELFPASTVVGLPAREILLGGGSIHCITLQQPLGKAQSMPLPG